MDKNLKRFRTERGISQKELARYLNISPSLISKWENGVTVPSGDYITRMSSYFNVDCQTVYDLFGNKRIDKVEDSIDCLESKLKSNLEDIRLTLSEEIETMSEQQKAVLDEQELLISSLSDAAQKYYRDCIFKIKRLKTFMIICLTGLIIALLAFIVLMVIDLAPSKIEAVYPSNYRQGTYE